MGELIYVSLVLLFLILVYQILSYLQAHEQVITSQTFFVIQRENVLMMISKETDSLFTIPLFAPFFDLLAIIFAGIGSNTVTTNEFNLVIDKSIDVTIANGRENFQNTKKNSNCNVIVDSMRVGILTSTPLSTPYQRTTVFDFDETNIEAHANDVLKCELMLIKCKCIYDCDQLHTVHDKRTKILTKVVFDI